MAEIEFGFPKMSVEEMRQLRRLISGASEPLRSKLVFFDNFIAMVSDPPPSHKWAAPPVGAVTEREGAR